MDLKTNTAQNKGDKSSSAFHAERLLAALAALEEDVRAFYLEELDRLTADMEQEARTASLSEETHERRWKEALQGESSETLVRKLAGGE